MGLLKKAKIALSATPDIGGKMRQAGTLAFHKISKNAFHRLQVFNLAIDFCEFFISHRTPSLAGL